MIGINTGYLLVIHKYPFGKYLKLYCAYLYYLVIKEYLFKIDIFNLIFIQKIPFKFSDYFFSLFFLLTICFQDYSYFGIRYLSLLHKAMQNSSGHRFYFVKQYHFKKGDQHNPTLFLVRSEATL